MQFNDLPYTCLLEGFIDERLHTHEIQDSKRRQLTLFISQRNEYYLLLSGHFSCLMVSASMSWVGVIVSHGIGVPKIVPHLYKETGLWLLAIAGK